MERKQTNLEKLMEQYLNELGYYRDIDFAFDFCPRTRYNYIIDFAFPDYKFGIECDGEHCHKANNEHDRKRDAFFKRNGWIILRFLGYDIINKSDEIKNKIKEFIRRIKLMDFKQFRDINDLIDLPQLKEILIEAGKYKGVGDWRLFKNWDE